MKTLFSRDTIRRVKNKLFPCKDISDEYFQTLAMIHSGSAMLPKENLWGFDYALKNLPTDDPILEIGSFTGMSTNMIIYYLKKRGKKNLFYTCDNWDFQDKEKDNNAHLLGATYEEYRSFIKESFKRNLNFFNGDRLPYSVELTSDEFFERWKSNEVINDVFDRRVKLGGKISFCYIDGNHKYKFVKNDFENVNRSLVKGGFVFFDDSADYFKYDVNKVIKEIKTKGQYESVIKNPNYLFRKLVN